MTGINNPQRNFMVVPVVSPVMRERREFASKVRAARAVLGWSQADLGQRVGVTQRSINRLEQADVDVRRSTAVAIEGVLRENGIVFEILAAGGFKMVVLSLKRSAPSV